MSAVSSTVAFQPAAQRSPSILSFEDDSGFSDDRAHLPDVARSLFRELRACGYDPADIATVAGELSGLALAHSRAASTRR